MDRRQFLALALAGLATPAAAFQPSPMRTQWRVRGSEALDAIALLGPLSGRELYRRHYQADADAFLPLLPGVQFVEFGDAEAVEDELYKADATGKGVAAVIMEPVQGEAGAIVPPDDFWPRIRKACDEYGALLIADEVQTGLGRTGKMFGVEHWNTVPDVLCLGKALGGGVMPLSAFVSTPKIWGVLEKTPFIHTSTFGGNPLACAAGIAAIHVTLEEDLAAQAFRKGRYQLRRSLTH